MNKSTTDFLKILTAKTYQRIHDHVARLDIEDSEKSQLAFEIYEAHANAIVSHMVDVYVSDDFKEQAVDDITECMNAFVKHFLKTRKEKQQQAH